MDHFGGRRNMPSGEVFTGPLEDSANGSIRFTVPSTPAGVEVSDVQLTFVDGEVVAARADRGHEYLEAALATDPARDSLASHSCSPRRNEHPRAVQ